MVTLAWGHRDTCMTWGHGDKDTGMGTPPRGWRHWHGDIGMAMGTGTPAECGDINTRTWGHSHEDTAMATRTLGQGHRDGHGDTRVEMGTQAQGRWHGDKPCQTLHGTSLEGPFPPKIPGFWSRTSPEPDPTKGLILPTVTSAPGKHLRTQNLGILGQDTSRNLIQSRV